MYISKVDLPELKQLYKNAVQNNQETFMFKEHEVLVRYAKYLIEYLEMDQDNVKSA